MRKTAGCGAKDPAAGPHRTFLSTPATHAPHLQGCQAIKWKMTVGGLNKGLFFSKKAGQICSLVTIKNGRAELHAHSNHLEGFPSSRALQGCGRQRLQMPSPATPLPRAMLKRRRRDRGRLWRICIFP